MAKAAPGFWAVWLWKLGMWGLVILFAVLYLGSVERHRGVTEGEPASAEPDGRSQVEMPVSTPLNVMSVGPEQTTSGPRDPVSESVSQAEAQAFAKAVMSGTDTESADEGPARAVGGAPGQLAVDAVVSPLPVVQPPVQSQMAGVSRLAPDRADQQVPESRSAVRHRAGDRAPEAVAPSIPVLEEGLRVSVGQETAVGAAPSSEPEADVPGAAVDGSQVAVPETAAQWRARIMGEYRAMQRAAQEEMRNRWSSMGRGYPYGAYPQWGYPPGMPPRGYGPAGQ